MGRWKFSREILRSEINLSPIPQFSWTLTKLLVSSLSSETTGRFSGTAAAPPKACLVHKVNVIQDN